MKKQELPFNCEALADTTVQYKQPDIDFFEESQGMYDEYTCKVYRSVLSSFEDLYEFYRNLPFISNFAEHCRKSIKKPLKNNTKISELIDPEYGPYQFLTEKSGLGKVILTGYLMRKKHGRVDPDITCVTTEYLVKTQNHYAYIHYYDQILH